MYKLDPAHFFSAPNLSWDAMLFSTETKLGLLDDIDKLLFFERARRGESMELVKFDTLRLTIPY